MRNDDDSKKDWRTWHVACSVRNCPERYRCDMVHDAKLCATYRAIVVKGLQVFR